MTGNGQFMSLVRTVAVKLRPHRPSCESVQRKKLLYGEKTPSSKAGIKECYFGKCWTSINASVYTMNLYTSPSEQKCCLLQEAMVLLNPHEIAPFPVSIIVPIRKFGHLSNALCNGASFSCPLCGVVTPGKHVGRMIARHQITGAGVHLNTADFIQMSECALFILIQCEHSFPVFLGFFTRRHDGRNYSVVIRSP